MKRKHPQQTRTISQWFLNIFIIISLLFCIALIPLFIYLQNTFTNLQLEKNRQKLNSGVSQISSIVTGMLNISDSLLSDSRFITLRYYNADYTNVPTVTRNQLKEAFESLMYPFQSLSHTALQLEQNVVITNATVFFEDHTCYYPDFFSVNDLSYTEWVQLLNDNGTGFLPVSHVKTYSEQYDALIYSTPWTNSTYLYTCMDVNNIKKMIIEEGYLNDCYYTITGIDGTLLYSDLPDTVSRHETISELAPSGKIKVSIHIPNSVFYRNMKPLYVFLTVYGCICVMMLITISILGTRFSAKPFIDIIQILERSRNITLSDNAKATGQQPSGQNLKSGFDYISNSILSADKHLGEYQRTLHTQQKILQARFFEKAVSGQLVSTRDIQHFHAYFPNFPKSYCLLHIRLWTYAEDASSLYAEPLLLLQSFLESELPNAYQQQFSDTELLLLIAEEDFEIYRQTLNFMVNNINREEPSYFVRCIAGRTYHHLESLPAAYRQLQDMDSFSFSDNQTHICTVTDRLEIPKLPVAMTDLVTLYTSITYGNREMALNKLQACSRELSPAANTSFKRPVYEIIQAMLAYVRLEHPQLLIDRHVPVYQANQSLYDQLAECIETFCDLINEDSKADKDPFTEELLQYIDSHYTDCDLCITSLETYFKCSESTIRKAFKSITDIPISRYIEQKRMARANELLAQNQKPIAEIASECGYTLPYSFYRAYKRVYGHAPTMQDNAACNNDNHSDES